MPNRFIEFISIVDIVLLWLLMLIASSIIILVMVKKRVERKRLYGLTTLVDTLRTIALLNPDTSKDTCPRLILKTNFQQFFELTKNIETVLPRELEQRVKDSFTAERIAAIEKQAKTSWRKWHKIEALLMLGYCNAPCAPAILKENITSRDEDVSYFSMVALGKIHTIESAGVLLDFLTKHIFSGQKIVSILEKFPPGIVEEIIKKVDHSDPLVRYWALKLLIKFKSVSSMERIMRRATDRSADVRSVSCECLGELGLPQAKPALLECLEDKAWFVRMHAVRALYQIEGTRCLAEVIGLIHDSAWLVKDSVRQIMAKDIEASLSHVAACLRDGDQSSQRVCIGALIDSGYIKTLLNNLLSHEAALKEKSVALLTLLINSNIHFGLKKTLDTFEENDHKRILEVVYTINKDLAGHIESH